MTERCISSECLNDTGFSYTLSLISGKYKMTVLYALMEFGVVRFNELKRYIGGISYKTLSITLKELEADQLVHREEYPQIPPKVEYSLTGRGKSLIPILDGMCEWGRKTVLFDIKQPQIIHNFYGILKYLYSNMTLIIVSALCGLALAGCGADVGKSSISLESSSSASIEPAVPSSPNSQPDTEENNAPETMSLEQAVISAVLEQNKGKYFPGEYQGVGCKIFETFEEGDKLAVYALIEYIEYGFEDNRFVNVSGTRARVLLDFQTGQEQAYTLTDYTILDPTSGLSEQELESLMAPLKETGKDYLYTDDDFLELREQVDAGAKEYLKSIGREGEVFERPIHEDGFLSFLNDDVYNTLMNDIAISNYPDWEGTLEKLEDGVRYVYQAHFDEVSNKIEYTKKNYDTDETVEKITADATTGERTA